MMGMTLREIRVKGGLARSAGMTAEERRESGRRAAVARWSRGGVSRLTAEERSEVGRVAARARWGDRRVREALERVGWLLAFARDRGEREVEVGALREWVVGLLEKGVSDGQ